ncbi:MAG TPA: cytochrome c oxidase assembly protein [Actinomycetales bacterium]|nr:cytochrome c oxidase assembly protein [Actinomycetales bacterium]
MPATPTGSSPSASTGTPPGGPRDVVPAARRPSQSPGRALPTLAGLPLPVLGLAALAAVVVGAVVTGATAPSLLADAGPTARWGQPLVRAVNDVSASLTIGLLVLVACALPGTRSARSAEGTRPADLTGLQERATRWAAGTGAVWVATGTIGIVLTYARLAGQSPFSPGFTSQLSYFVTDLEIMRSLLVSVLVSAVVATGAAVATRRSTVGWMAVLALGALLPIALTGHAAGSNDHETAVDSLAFHLIGVTVWVGGLAALVIVRPSLGKALAAVTSRYSTLALWCFVLVAGSGIVNAALRVGAWSGLTTPYGALVLAKVTALVLLGVAGATHRRWLLPRLRAGDPGPFWRLVIGELVVMGTAIGLGVALAASAPPVPAEPVADPSIAFAITGYPMPAAPTALSWVATWRPDILWVTVAIVLAGTYVYGAVRLHQRGDHWSLGRTLPWLLGCVVLVWATSGAPGVYGRVLFSAHMLGHMTMSMMVPPLLVLGAPITLALRVSVARHDGSRGLREWLLVVVHSRAMAVLGNPIVAGAFFAISLIVFYYSPLFPLSLRTHTGHVLMHLHFLLAGYLFASVLIGVDPGPKRPPYPLRMVLLFATMSFHAFFGVFLLQGNLLLAGDLLTQLASARDWGRPPLADQQLGGAITWGVGEVPTLLMALGVAVAWVRSDERDGRRQDRQADRDGGAELAAYNARLARLADHDARLDAAEQARELAREQARDRAARERRR